MHYRCSRCHTAIETEGDAEPQRCPSCGAEIGFERAAGLPTPMLLFGSVLVAAIVTAATGGLLSRVIG